MIDQDKAREGASLLASQGTWWRTLRLLQEDGSRTGVGEGPRLFSTWVFYVRFQWSVGYEAKTVLGKIPTTLRRPLRSFPEGL